MLKTLLWGFLEGRCGKSRT